jgi:DNA-directed RNA polymerase subunit K/omega
MEKTEKPVFTKYERARILGARALQLSMDAPVLMKIPEEMLSNLNFDPLRIAEVELDCGVLPISVKRPLPERTKEKLRAIKETELAGGEESDEQKVKIEQKETKDIAEEGEIMEIAAVDDEFEDFEESGTGGTEELE